MFSTVLDAIDVLSSLPSDSSLCLSLLLGTFPGSLSHASSLRIANAVFAFVVSTSRSV